MLERSLIPALSFLFFSSGTAGSEVTPLIRHHVNTEIKLDWLGDHRSRSSE